MNANSSTVRHGFASLGILLLLLISLYSVLVYPALARKSENNERIENLVFQLGKIDKIKSKIDNLKKEINQLGKQNTNKANFLKNDTPAIVAADLQKKIKRLVESSGAILISTHGLTGKSNELYPKITIKVHLRADINALSTIFYQIRINKPLLFTDNILLQKRNSASRKTQGMESRIEVKFDVSGYIPVILENAYL